MTKDDWIRRAIEVLTTIAADCDMAISGEWEPSNEGFQAMKESCEDLLTSQPAIGELK